MTIGNKNALERLRHRGPETRIAVVGASNNPEKYGNIIVKNLAGKGYTVLPVNPKDETVAGLKAYRNVREIDPPPHIVTMVTPPPATKKVLEELAQSAVPVVWLQDGSWDDAVLETARAARFETVHDACIMVASNFP
ncbi:MAG: CoA-binding protein [Acidobacteria bacterium]|nr:CoA-binding protein [Acidobacteriota bacterium]